MKSENESAIRRSFWRLVDLFILHGGLPSTAEGSKQIEAQIFALMSNTSPERQHIITPLRPLEKICPVLHQPGTWLKEKRMIVGRADGAARLMSRL